MKRITIIGAGLAGMLVSLYLARRGYEIDIFESRPDLRVSPADYGRSINLALSCRGLTGLEAMDLYEDVKTIMVPMRARAIHAELGTINYQSFGRHENEYINAIQRNELNALLLNKAELTQKIRLHFNTRLINLDVHKKTMSFEAKDGTFFNHHYTLLIGADGAGSQVRETLQKKGLVKATREFLTHGYKEIFISTKHGIDMAREHLHLWPRNSFLLLGNPNKDDSITGSLFLEKEGPVSFAALNREDLVIDFFKKEFTDVYAAMPNLVEDFFEHPIGHLSTVKCTPWHYEDSCLLIGDAAHGIVPFFGQGMNCAFEDCRILDVLLDTYADDWSRVLPIFYQQRKVNTDAVSEMSMDNYHEIEEDILDKKFLLKKRVEHEIMRRYPKRYVSKHVLVMFTNTPYAEAKAQGEIQKEFIHEICRDISSLEELDWQKVDRLLP